MAERELAILLKARDLASGPIKRVKGDITGLGKAAKGAGGSLKTVGKGLAVAGAGVAGFVGLAVKSGLDSLVTLEAANATTASIIKSTGGAAKVSGKEVRDWAEEIEKATGAAVDDKAIQAAENLLLRSGAVSEKNFKRVTTASVDLGAAMKKGPEAGAKALSKAMADPTKAAGALRKAGIFLTAQDEDRIKGLYKLTAAEAKDFETMDKGERKRFLANKQATAQAAAQAFVLGKVEKATKGAAAASVGPLQRSQNILADAWEDAKMALATGFLPILTKVADKLSGALADPKTMTDIKNIGQGLADGFEKVLDVGQKVPWASIKDAMLAGKEFAGKAFELFMGLPPWVQTAVVTGWGLNKITGGALSNVIGSLASGLIKGVLGISAGVVNVKAATVVGGGLGAGGAVGGGGAVTKAGKASKIASAVSKVFMVGMAAGVIAELLGVKDEQTAANRQGEADLTANTKNFTTIAGVEDMKKSLAGILTYDRKLSTDLTAEGAAFQFNIDGVRDSVRDQEAALVAAINAAADKQVTGAGKKLDDLSFVSRAGLASVNASVDNDRIASAQATAANARDVASAIRDKDLSVHVKVPVTNTQIVSVRDLGHGAVNYGVRTHTGSAELQFRTG